MRWTFTQDAEEFSAGAGDFLAADPVASSVVATIALREQQHGPARIPDHWWAVCRDRHDQVVGVAMRTAPFAPYPPFLMEMPEAAAVGLAEELLTRDQPLGGINGAAGPARALAARVAQARGVPWRVAVHTRLFELGDLIPPRPVPGRLRPVDPESPEELALLRDWVGEFHRDADAQAGRPEGFSSEATDWDEAELRRVATKSWWWEVDGAIVHLVGVNPPAMGVARVGPVYTPAAYRGRGYASAAVAQVSLRILDGGDRACLYTDQANPTSNAIYQRLGYRRVVDEVQIRID